VQVVTVSIEDLDEDGRGVGRAEDLELHAPGALPGETVKLRVEHRSPHAPRAWGEVLERVGEAAAERVPPACPGHGRCGGCVLQHLAYPAQLTFKRRRVERELAAHPALAGLGVDDVVAAPRELHYRNKAKYVLAPGPRLASYAPGSHELVDMAGCQVPEEPIDAVARAFAQLARDAPVYDERSGRGELRHLVVRANPDGEVLVVVVARSLAARPLLARAAHALRAAHPGVVGVVLNVSPERGNVIFGDHDEPLAGASTLRDEIAGVPLELSARSFFQVNRAQAERLYAAAVTLARVGPGRRAVDLYSGVGLIAFGMAAAGARVVGVESLPEAVADARRAALAVGRDVRFLAADAAAGLAEAARELGGVDVIAVNPPRKGLAAARAAVLAARAPRVVYVSCGPRSLAADLAAFVSAGYRVDSVRPFDLMPGTPQVETLVTLSRPGSAPRAAARAR
jgi:23S rRNA (uracil1939-C5)-methyltransferase